MAKYKSIHTGPQIDSGVSKALNPDTVPTAGSDALMTSGGTKSALNTVENDIAIRVVGNKTTYASGAAIGQYVIVDGSSIAGITDGMYKAAKAIPYNTVIDSTYLTATSGGGLNDLKAALSKSWNLVSAPTDANEVSIDLTGYEEVCIVITDNGLVVASAVFPKPVVETHEMAICYYSVAGTITAWARTESYGTKFHMATENYPSKLYAR